MSDLIRGFQILTNSYYTQSIQRSIATRSNSFLFVFFFTSMGTFLSLHSILFFSFVFNSQWH
ncbi:hypothetical protein BDV29DRAFT_176305 [Aspergillus leporis]|uniref:Uncharacterized protein n=1 Tax=Aspergillus leporis TaxID=41062 RepID=A0A5N5WZ17_9EURO|nr:hypothetical protein BDV29DRAFT_176305 [Aspergillus leporis]